MSTGPLQTALGVVLIIAFVIGMSAVCYYAIEKPGRAFLGGRRSAATGGATAP